MKESGIGKTMPLWPWPDQYFKPIGYDHLKEHDEFRKGCGFYRHMAHRLD